MFVHSYVHEYVYTFSDRHIEHSCEPMVLRQRSNPTATPFLASHVHKAKM